MADTYDAGKHGGGYVLDFGIANAVTNKTNEDLALANASGVTLAVMPQSGSVVGISVRSSAAVTAGSVSFKAHKDGTEFTQTGYPNPALNSTTSTNESYVSIRPGVLTFSAGEGLGISYTSTTDCAPTDSNDYSLQLYYQLDPN